MAQAKIELKLGTSQFTAEAEAAWLEKQLDKFLTHVKAADVGGGSAEEPNTVQTKFTQHKTKDVTGTTGNIAAKLKCKVGAGKDIITAAAARLTFGESKESFTRAKLLDEAKSATAYYKKTVANNLSNTLDGLVKSGDFTEIAKGTYSLSATKREELKKRLAS
jgi:hypothetical protein